MSKKTDKKIYQLNPDEVFIGMKVMKHSGNPFKYGGKTGTVSGITVNPDSGKPAVIIEEDNTIVDIYQVKKI